MCDDRKYPEHYVVVPGLEKYYKHTLKNVKEVKFDDKKKSNKTNKNVSKNASK